MKYYKKTVATQVGELILAGHEKALMAMTWDENDLKEWGIRDWDHAEECEPLLEAEKQLQEYLTGKRKQFDLRFDLRGTDFQKRVWKELQRIPFGKTWSYGELAHRIGNPLASRAVGSANAKNPICIFIPCHRVIRGTGEIGGYAGGVGFKKMLLKLEGCEI